MAACETAYCGSQGVVKAALCQCLLLACVLSVNSSWYVVSYTGMQLTAFLPSGIVVRLPAALLASFSLQS